MFQIIMLYPMVKNEFNLKIYLYLKFEIKSNVINYIQSNFSTVFVLKTLNLYACAINSVLGIEF